MTDEEKPESKRRWAKRIFLLTLFSGISIAIWYLVLFLNGPSIGVMTEKEAEHSLDIENIPPAMREWKGEYFSISLRESYLEKRHGKASDSGVNILESAFFAEDTLSSRKLAVTIEKAPGNGVEELSSYAFRMLHPEEYVRETHDWDGENIMIFRKESQVYEVTGYLENGDVVASISVTSAVDAPEKLIADFSDIIKSFRWASHESQ
ncbi:MAG: hypothetical protein KBD19_04020 [Candidatus Moranbacteria bacterium]|jgi:hypothetical protein|nr:hypothetical protein [Candidatus Moranbacteria bacterium]